MKDKEILEKIKKNNIAARENLEKWKGRYAEKLIEELGNENEKNN